MSLGRLLYRGSSRLVIVLREDGDISLDPDIVQGMHVIAQELAVTLTPLDLRAVHALLHLQILLIRREGARLGQDVRVADVGVDVVRRRTAVFGAVLQLEGWKQTADDGQAGADQADAGLDVCPQGGLVDGVGWVDGADPEEDDDAVDTGEADEATDGEDAVDGELVLPGAVQPPDHGDGQSQDHKVHEDVEGLVGDDEDFGVEALALHALVPVCAEWAALAGASEEDAGAPGADEAVQAEGEALEFGGCEDAAVEADDGDFDARAEEEVGELVGEEDLVGLDTRMKRPFGLTYLPVVGENHRIQSLDMRAIATDRTPCASQR